jgi:alkylation response protein AidB-like acyl-CoA dehydrogenase
VEESRPVDRGLPTQEAVDLLALTREIADAEPVPEAARYEHEERFHRETSRLLGEIGLLRLPVGEQVGGGGQPWEVALQVV